MERRGEVKVRPAVSGDLDRVAEVWHESSARMDGAVAEMPTRAQLRRRIDDELRDGWALHVGLRDERIVGMVALKPDEAVLDQIFVLPSEQRQGVGRALLDLAKSEMPRGFTLRAAAANHGGRRFYEREGLTPLGEGVHPRTGTPVCYFGWKVASIDAPGRSAPRVTGEGR